MKFSVHLYTCVAAALLCCVATPAIGELVDHYEFENDGVDSAGGNANGNVGANVTFTTGANGQGAQFGTNGSTAARRIVVLQADAFNPGAGDFSMAFWAQRNDVDSGTSDGIFDALSGTTTGYQAQFTGGDVVRLRLDDQGGNQNALIDSVSTITDSDFHHYTFTVDRTGEESRVYIDGQLDAIVDISGDNLVGTISPSQNLHIGGINNNNNTGMEGVLDDLQFYSGVLSADQVAALVAVPEPTSITIWSLIGMGLAGFGYYRVRRQK